MPDTDDLAGGCQRYPTSQRCRACARQLFPPRARARAKATPGLSRAVTLLEGEGRADVHVPLDQCQSAVKQ